MKAISKVAVVLFFFFLSSQAFAQLSIGGQVSYLNVFGGTGLKNLGLGIKADYAKSDKVGITGGFNYYFPSKYSDITYANAFSSQTSPSQVEVDVEHQISFIHVYIGGKLYFVGDYDADLGFYGIAEGGLLMAPTTTTLGNFDESRYSTTQEDGAKETFSNLTLNFGVGIEKNFDFGYLFADLKLNLPANQANDETVEVEIPSSVSINAGIRVPFN